MLLTLSPVVRKVGVKRLVHFGKSFHDGAPGPFYLARCDPETNRSRQRCLGAFGLGRCLLRRRLDGEGRLVLTCKFLILTSPITGECEFQTLTGKRKGALLSCLKRPPSATRRPPTHPSSPIATNILLREFLCSSRQLGNCVSCCVARLARQ